MSLCVPDACEWKSCSSSGGSGWSAHHSCRSAHAFENRRNYISLFITLLFFKFAFIVWIFWNARLIKIMHKKTKLHFCKKLTSWTNLRRAYLCRKWTSKMPWVDCVSNTLPPKEQSVTPQMPQSSTSSNTNCFCFLTAACIYFSVNCTGISTRWQCSSLINRDGNTCTLISDMSE